MKDRIIGYFHDGEKLKYSLLKLWIRGVLFWILFQLVSLVLVAALFSNELDLLPQFFSSIVYLIFSSYAALVIYFTYLSIIESESRLWKMFYNISIVTSFSYFVIKNMIPRIVGDGPHSNGSPFDELWYTLPQTSFGFPTPYLRFLYYDLEDVGNPIIDLSSFFGNIFLYLFFIYLLMLIYILFGKFSRNNSQV